MGNGDKPGIVAGERIVPYLLWVCTCREAKARSFHDDDVRGAREGWPVSKDRRGVAPDRNGKADLATVAAARLIGIDEVYALGGVQAVAALAFGTATIPRVDKIVRAGFRLRAGSKADPVHRNRHGPACRPQ